MIRGRGIRWFLVAGSLLGWLVSSVPVRGQAKVEPVRWDEPIQLSNPAYLAWAPVIVADVSGQVHVMWSQTMLDVPVPGEGDTIFYTRSDGTQWIEPVDVLVSSRSRGAEFPDIVIDGAGVLHAVWGTGGRDSELMYAHAPVCCADDPHQWSAPLSLGSPVNLTTALVVDNLGRLHAAFASVETGGIVYRRSDDGGLTWPVWVDILGGIVADDDQSAYPRLTVDASGRVHLVWSVLPWSGQRVMYARSDDGGDHWLAPRIIDDAGSERYEESYGPIFIDIEAHGAATLHLIWDGAPTVERNHLWSYDAGESWLGPDILFPELTIVGRQGWNDMVVDSNGTLHAVCLGKNPRYDSWPGDPSQSTIIGDMHSAEFMRLALGLNNHLHAVWMDHESPEHHTVWYVHGMTSAPSVASQPLSVFSPPSSSVSHSTSITAPEVGLPRPFEGGERSLSAQARPSHPAYVFLISAAPAVLLVGFVLIFKRLHFRGR